MKTIEKINLITGEYIQGDVIINSSKTKAGSTSYMIVESVNAAINGESVLICSMEEKATKLQIKVNKAFAALTKKNNSAKLIIREFKAGDFFILDRIKTFVNALKKENKKPSIVFIDAFELSFEVNSKKPYKDMIMERIKQVKEMAKELNAVFVINIQSYTDEDWKVYDKLEKIVDFIILLKKGEQDDFSILPIYCRGTWKDIRISGKFDFKKMKLDFKNLNFSFEKKLAPIASLFDNSSLHYLVSPTKEDESTFTLIMAEYFSEIGNRVSFIGYVNREKRETISKRVKKNIGNINFVELIPFGDFLTNLKNHIEAYELDKVFINDADLYAGESFQEIVNFNEKLRKISIEKNCAIIAGSQTRKISDSSEFSLADISKSSAKASISDGVVGVRKFKYGWFRRFLEFIMFWRPKTNFKINVMKNRYGANGNALYANVNFENNKIKILKKL